MVSHSVQLSFPKARLHRKFNSKRYKIISLMLHSLIDSWINSWLVKFFYRSLYLARHYRIKV